MSNHAEREEYVQEDAGIIFVGSTNRIGMVGWNFGQVKEAGVVSLIPKQLSSWPHRQVEVPKSVHLPALHSFIHSEDIY